MKRFAWSLCLSLAALTLPTAMLSQEAVNQGNGAVLRVLDKLNGTVTDLTISNGSNRSTGRIDVYVEECRYPVGNPSGDAYALLAVREAGEADPAFAGWMIASSPALNAMNHPRYDVWVLNCLTS